jgi:hypothetical protein
MSKEGEENVQSIIDPTVAAGQPPMTKAQQERQEKINRKQAADDLADYVKRLRKSNEMKTLQVEELNLGIEYYKAKMEFRKLKPKMDELDAIEEAEAKEQQKAQKEAYEAHLKEQEENKPKIVIPKTGKARDK